MAVNDTTLPIPNPTEAIVDRNRYLTPKWFNVFKRLLDTMRTTANAMDTVQETVDQLNGTWTLSLNSNNRVVGYVKLDGSAISTVFAVLASNFKIINPSANNEEIEAFIEGLVNGIPTVGINGNLVVDDTILARHIQTDSLAALSAVLGDVTTGRIRSPNGKLDINALGSSPYIRLTNT